MQKGAIRVQTENIFPIIKKFLYSDHEIFIRELVSNAVDATQKLKTLASVGEFKGELGELEITVAIDKEKKTLTISDRGVGMTAGEVDKYINQLAFSGAEEFLNKYKGQGDGTNIIGHFGLGFYAGFMVSNEVEIITQSWQNAPAVRWVCDGSPEYTLEETTRADRGTDIVLHINEESEEFLEPSRLRGMLEKFCKFLPIPIKFEGQQINNPHPAWTKKPSELTDEDYINFYRELYPFGEPPLFWIHLNVDYPFNLTGILYFPKITKSYEIQKDKINLYSNQVYVTDQVNDIVPEFLMLLHGVIDSPDIPLNVSRSYLQGDPNVKKINAHITKKVADKLEEMFRNDRKAFEEKWEHIGLFVKYGMMTDDKFLEKANKFHLFPGVNGSTFYTLEEYRTSAAGLQTNHEGKLIILYATAPVQQDAYIQAAHAKGYIVVKLDTMVDAAFINQAEQKWENVQFTRVDADIADNLIDPIEKTGSVLLADQETALKTLFEEQVKPAHIKVDLKGLSTDAEPVIVTRPEFMRRMKDMAAAGGGGMSWYANMPDEVNMTINANHPIYQDILAQSDAGKKEKLVKNLADLALLSQGLLTGADLTAFVHRSVELLHQHK
ncbi:molecular chaperone HtpG [Chitinophaga costaii]|uniref:Chaperone protein HtpG n=1 Tax=Chitinophaga costaii TaxID=1335309 RepID=A0A1C4BT16_9BACT|nr:molecular chaperone HtpG [Chitinophaga costaii]PUZ27484.1 molecular chaperone HtpG [Chitinophaga costaii]SCC09977.1 molecular chaperone HtpG [Chitinophaga costaii]